MPGNNELANYTVKMENNASGDPVYVGKTARGNASSLGVWQIQKITYDGNGGVTDVQWPSKSDKFDFVWDDRTSYTYT